VPKPIHLAPTGLRLVCAGVCCLVSFPAWALAAETNNAQLRGDYTFIFDGFRAGSSAAYAAVGRFTADGRGGLRQGEMDANSAGASVVRHGASFTGTYSVDADHRGSMTWVVANGALTFALALTRNGNAEFVGAESGSGFGLVGSGTIIKADVADFSTAAISGDYAFGFSGFNISNRRTGLAGRFTANGAGVLTNASADLNEYSATQPVTFRSATYACFDTHSGRGAIRLDAVVGRRLRHFGFAFYMANAGTLLALRSDTVTRSAPLLHGSVLHQNTPPAGFRNADWKGDLVLFLTARTTCGSGWLALEMLKGLLQAGCGMQTQPGPVVLAGLLSADGRGKLALTFDQNCGGVHASVTNLPGSYQVGSNGRTLITTRPYQAVAYLIDSRHAFMLGTDSSGLLEARDGSGPTPDLKSGLYAGRAAAPASPSALVFTGRFNAAGNSPTGTLRGTEDIDSAPGTVRGSTFAASYSFASASTRGRGMLSSGSEQIAVMYVVSPDKFVAIPLHDPNPAVWVFER